MRVRPLLVRDGVRYACAGDGLCCTDAHVLGRVTRAEAKRANAFQRGVTYRNEELGIVALRVVSHRCVFLDEAGCRFHRERGPREKPATCRHFPLGVVATPNGGRVVTDHRCPCRTMGDRPRLLPEAALASLTEAGERLEPLGHATKTIALSRGRRVSFARYAELEATLLARLASGEAPELVLDAEPFPRLHGITWGDVAHTLRGQLDGSSGGDALAWAGDAILSVFGTTKPQLRARPWSEAFDRAETRSTEGDAELIFRDWIADEIWSLAWTQHAPFDIARAAIASQLAIARWVSKRLTGVGVRSDRAAAESVLVAELLSRAGLWRTVVRAIRLSGGPFPLAGRPSLRGFC
jgi:Fe-S-cluster containining protein